MGRDVYFFVEDSTARKNERTKSWGTSAGKRLTGAEIDEADTKFDKMESKPAAFDFEKKGKMKLEGD